jgi:hypothetical protein
MAQGSDYTAFFGQPTVAESRMYDSKDHLCDPYDVPDDKQVSITHNRLIWAELGIYVRDLACTFQGFPDLPPSFRLGVLAYAELRDIVAYVKPVQPATTVEARNAVAAMLVQRYETYLQDKAKEFGLILPPGELSMQIYIPTEVLPSGGWMEPHPSDKSWETIKWNI